jgi:hypothetical protein
MTQLSSVIVSGDLIALKYDTLPFWLRRGVRGDTCGERLQPARFADCSRRRGTIRQPANLRYDFVDGAFCGNHRRGAGFN